MVFDPKNVVHVIREVVIAQFSSSQEIRTRVILLSNVFGALGKSPVLNSKIRSVVTYLSSEAHQSIARFTSGKPNTQREVDMMNALKSIDLMMEVRVILLRRFGGSISTIVGLMEAAAPVFQRACPDPPGHLINLPSILISPSINLRHYAETDIMTATLLARPMFIRYNVVYTPEINELFTAQQAGLHWLHGIPDQLIILLAWINMLYADFGTNADPLLVSQIEMEVEKVKITPSTSDDPVYTIRRSLTRLQTICGAHAEDPRVVKFVKRFMRFLGGVKPARNVDTFLSLPIMFIGTFVSRKQDRDLLFRRLTTMQECTMPGRAGHDCLMILCDIWRRTEEEQRPATWADLRISSQTVRTQYLTADFCQLAELYWCASRIVWNRSDSSITQHHPAWELRIISVSRLMHQVSKSYNLSGNLDTGHLEATCWAASARPSGQTHNVQASNFLESSCRPAAAQTGVSDDASFAGI
ncbi:hypothetical protein AG1IA_03112 [Rhizoctonia solani AG-1 IA]|uniref:Uncharacterized protein n=1 Tax=Thanatephorus cucumeris (strain AG1-IA) TaxID=983506 RepID=L8X196_THACA|nr:hypothetical protein AG1IA_03112 [Rhizoctonia solani AG-1 IA]